MAVVGGIDGVVDFAAGDLGLDVAVHGEEARGRALGLAGAAGIDDGIARASRGAFLEVNRAGSSQAEERGPDDNTVGEVHDCD